MIYYGRKDKPPTHHNTMSKQTTISFNFGKGRLLSFILTGSRNGFSVASVKTNILPDGIRQSVKEIGIGK